MDQIFHLIRCAALSAARSEKVGPNLGLTARWPSLDYASNSDDRLSADRLSRPSAPRARRVDHL
jgi:hypothetical protein